LEVEDIEQISSLHRHHHAARHVATDLMLDRIRCVFEPIDLGASLTNGSAIAHSHGFDQGENFPAAGNGGRYVLLHRSNRGTSYEFVNPCHISLSPA
jgi:hypothetical protein